MPIINTTIAETINITENGIHNVAKYTNANVNVAGSGAHSIVKPVDENGVLTNSTSIIDLTGVNEIGGYNALAYAYFNVSRDLSVCYSDVAHHPFNHLWNAYNPFRRCDHVEIQSPDELKDIVMTWDGKTFDEFNWIKGKNK